MNNLLNGLIILAVLITLALSIVSLVLPCKKSSFGDDTNCKKLQNYVNCSVGEQCCSGYCNFSSTHTKCVGDGKSKWCQCMASPPAPPPGPSPPPGPPSPFLPHHPICVSGSEGEGIAPFQYCSGDEHCCTDQYNNKYKCLEGKCITNTYRMQCTPGPIPLPPPNEPDKIPHNVYDHERQWCCYNESTGSYLVPYLPKSKPGTSPSGQGTITGCSYNSTEELKYRGLYCDVYPVDTKLCPSGFCRHDQHGSGSKGCDGDHSEYCMPKPSYPVSMGENLICQS